MVLHRIVTKSVLSFLALFLLFPGVQNAQETKLVSSSEGQITDIVLCGVPPARCLMYSLVREMLAVQPNREMHLYYEAKELFQAKTDTYPCDIQFLESFHPIDITSSNKDAFELSLQASVERHGIAHRIYTESIAYVSKWPQDEFNLVELGDHTRMSVYGGSPSQEAHFFEAFGSQTLKLTKSYNSFLEEDGNIQFLDDKVFIGIDVLKDNEMQVIQNFYPNKTIIFLGAETPRLFQNTLSHQPAFHLDLFFNAIKLSPSHYLIVYSMFDENSANENEQLWNTQIEETHKKLLDQIPDSITLDRLDIPLVMREGIPYSFSNGIFETINNTVYAYLPYYINVSHRVSTEIRKLYAAYGVKVKFIRSGKQGFDKYIQHKGSLHCMTKVLHRN